MLVLGRSVGPTNGASFYTDRPTTTEVGLVDS